MNLLWGLKEKINRPSGIVEGVKREWGGRVNDMDPLRCGVKLKGGDSHGGGGHGVLCWGSQDGGNGAPVSYRLCHAVDRFVYIDRALGPSLDICTDSGGGRGTGR